MPRRSMVTGLAFLALTAWLAGTANVAAQAGPALAARSRPDKTCWKAF